MSLWESPAPPIDIRSRNNISVTGTGRPIVFAHGYGCSQEMWRFIAPHFQDSHQVVLFDHVGSGSSDLAAYHPGKYDSLEGYASDLVEILDELDLQDAIVVGHSVGAIIGLLAANQVPHRVSALVLIGPSPKYVDSDDYRGGFSVSDIDSLLQGLDSNYFSWSTSIAPIIMGAPEQPELAAELADSFCKSDPTIARHFAHVTFMSDNRRDLAAVQVPTLIVQSGDDFVAPVHVGEYVAHNIADSSLVVLPISGHCAHLSAPALVVTAVQDFLRER